jgi:Common central domain of tyrosinase/Bacterial TSP3 repeat
MRESAMGSLALYLVLLLVLTGMTAVQIDPAGAQRSEPVTCKVDITRDEPLDNSSRMYPGQHTIFSTNVSEGIPVNYSWNVEGPIIKDYDDDVYQSDTLTASANLENETYMSPGDFRQKEIDFYWRPTTADSNRTITVTVDTSNGASCKDSQSYIVERNYDNIDLQAEDFYVAQNHRDPLAPYDPNSTRVLKQHAFWHNNYSFGLPSYIDNGDLFVDFHRNYIAHFDAWRNLFGYDNVKAWDPGAQFDVGVDMNHSNRLRQTDLYLQDPLPPWFRHHAGGEGDEDRPIIFWKNYTGQNQLPSGHPLAGPGGPTIIFRDSPYQHDSPDPRNRTLAALLNGHTRPLCEEADAPSNSSQYPLTQNALIDFEPDLELFGCAITAPYHNQRHGAVGQGGDMSFTDAAPKDPIFWRLHKFLDNVAMNREFPTIAPRITDEAMFFTEPSAPAAPRDQEPPRVYSQNPFRLNPYITALPLISEQEKDLFGEVNIPAISAEFNEPVVAVNATDFIVNGSPAIKVNGTGSGPYVFVGFEYPQIGPVNITFSPGNITDRSGNQFEGTSWEYIIIDPNADNDQDGIKDSLEAESVLTNPKIKDTDGDGISDGTEVANLCLNPLSNDAHIMNMSDIIISETGRDTDSDGVTNVQEVSQGTDPCLPPKDKRNIQIDGTFMDFEGLLPLSQIRAERAQPFALAIKTAGGIAGLNNILTYDSFTGEAVSIVNGNETRGQISNSDEDLAIRTLNSSAFFEAASFYPPLSNSIDYLEYTMFTILGNKIHGVYWTDLSEEVPEDVQNLPYVMANILGTGKEFVAKQQP